MKTAWNCALLSVLLLLLSSCGAPTYRYNNLTTSSDVDELRVLLADAKVPLGDTEALLRSVATYNQGAYAMRSLRGGWKMASITKRLYDYPEAINAFTAKPFDDLNCRKAALLVYHPFPESALFSSAPLNGSVADSVLALWEENHVAFEQGLHLVSLWGAKDARVDNLHCGVSLVSGNGIYFFEKTDPMLPYQLSVFETQQHLKTYLLSRTKEYADMTVFVDDVAI